MNCCHIAAQALLTRPSLRFPVLSRGTPARGLAKAVEMPASNPALAETCRPLPRFDRLKGILFDIDGTLTNSDPLHFRAFQELLQEVNFQDGVPIDEEFFRQRISGRHNPEIARDLFPQWTEERRREFYEAKESRFRDLASTVLQRMPGLTEFLELVDQQGYRKAAVTNAPRANTELMLQALGLDTYFEVVVLGEECPRAKPHPDPYQHALKALDLTPEQALVIEDSPSGMAAAVAAGIAVVGITSGQTAETLMGSGAAMIIADFHQLLRVAREDLTPTGG